MATLHLLGKNLQDLLIQKPNIQDDILINISSMQEREPTGQTEGNIEQSNKEQYTVFTDPDGPYLNAPKKLRDLYDEIREGQKINLDKFDLQKLGLPEKRTENNFCSRYMEADQRFYVCSNCSYRASLFSSMVFCIGCYEPEKHIGHDVRDRTYSYKSGAYCDCGRIDRLKQESLCKHHSNYSTEIQCEIPEEERKYFLDCFDSLISCQVYQCHGGIFEKIVDYFNKLNENSVYYNRLILQLLKLPIRSKFSKYKNCIYLLFFQRYSQFFVHLGGDLVTRTNLAKLFLSLPKTQKQNEQIIQIPNDVENQTINITIIQRLIDEEFQYHNLIKIVERNQNREKIKNQKLQKLYSSLITKASKIQQLEYYQNNLKGVSSSLDLLKKVSQILTFDKKQEKQEDKQDLSFEGRELGKRLLVRSFGIFLLSDKNNILNLRSELIKKGLTDESIDNLLGFMIQNSSCLVARNEGEGFNFKFYFLQILLLLRQSKRKKEFADKLWNNIHSQVKKSSQNKLVGLVDVFHYYISILLNIQITLIMESRQFLNEPLEDHSEKVQEKLQNWFRCILYEVKEISRGEIIDFKNKGVLSFKSAGKILNELCTYNQQQETFYYKTSNVYKSVLNQFPMIPSKQNLGSIYNNQLKFGDPIPVQEGSLSEVLIQQFLNSDLIVPLFEETKKSSFSQGQWTEQQKSGYLYLFFLVVYDALKKSNNQIRQRLQKLKDNQQLLKEQSQNAEELRLKKRLLNIKQEKIEEKQEKKEEKEEEKVQQQKKVDEKMVRAQEKKKKIAAKFQQKRLKLLENITSFKNHSQSQQEEQICILCHEKAKENNQLFYLAEVSKNISCGAFYGKNNVCNLSLMTCFHALHLECYKNLGKQSDQSFNCPLCQFQRNCILPVSLKYNKKANTMCYNIITASLVFIHKIYNTESLFSVIFQHLVQSKGLNSILSLTRYAQKRNSWQRNDEYLQMMISAIYDNSKEDQKKVYLEQISQLVAQIQKCEAKEHRAIQLLLTQAVKESITLQDEHVVEKLLLETRSLIDQSNFAIINAQITCLHDHQFTLPQQTKQEAQKPKATLSLSLIQLPEQAKDFPEKFNLIGNCKVCTTGLKQFLCLVCGEIVCRSCLPKHSSEIHCGASIFIDIKNLLVYCNVGKNRSNGPVYSNYFRINYHERLESQLKIFEKDEYYLNKATLNKFVNKCLFN